MYSCDDIIDLAVQIEKNGEKTLRKALESISNPKLIPVLQSFADEEVQHAEWFSKLKPSIDESMEDPGLEELGKSLMRDVLGDQSFSLDDADFSKIEKINELLSLMIEFEKDTVLFYEVLEPFIEDDGTLANLKRIIAEENNHISKLQGFAESELALSLNRDA